MSDHKSGIGSSSRLAKRRRRSSIAVTQELAESSSTAAQVGPHGQPVRPESIGDLADRQVGVVEEDHGGALPLGQLTDSREQVVAGKWYKGLCIQEVLK